MVYPLAWLSPRQSEPVGGKSDKQELHKASVVKLSQLFPTAAAAADENVPSRLGAKSKQGNSRQRFGAQVVSLYNVPYAGGDPAGLWGNSTCLVGQLRDDASRDCRYAWNEVKSKLYRQDDAGLEKNWEFLYPLHVAACKRKAQTRCRVSPVYPKEITKMKPPSRPEFGSIEKAFY
uniref:Uncharacterized protein n=1 Tax=Trichuris muris TaxID=70415 RepID=A0A5S6QEZ3_TRIMR